MHGAAWEFNRDEALQARNYFARPTQANPNPVKPRLEQNQFGASLGGPLRPQQDVRVRLLRGSPQHQRPVAEHRGRQLTPSAPGTSASTAIRDPLTGLPFPNNAIPADRISPTARRLLDEFVPRANDGGTRFIAFPDATDDRDQVGVRFDYTLSQKNSVLVRYLRSNTTSVTPPTTRPIGTVAKATLQDVMLSDTHLFTPRMINVARFAYNEITAQPQATSGLSSADYGINVPQNVTRGRGPPQHHGHRLLQRRRCGAAVRQPAERGGAVHRRRDVGDGSALDQVRRWTSGGSTWSSTS